eukprot:1779509-Alexandrium_andersonii.AAC.1
MRKGGIGARWRTPRASSDAQRRRLARARMRRLALARGGEGGCDQAGRLSPRIVLADGRGKVLAVFNCSSNKQGTGHTR